MALAGRHFPLHDMDFIRISASETSACASSLLKSYGRSKSLPDARHIHHLLVHKGLHQNVFLGTLLLQTYALCGALEDACMLFDSLHPRNVFLSNVIIGAFAKLGQAQEPLQVFWQMQQEGILPDRVTFVCILSSCANQTQGKHIHARLASCTFKFDVVIRTALVNMYGRSGSLEGALETFNESPDRDVISWNAMMTLYAQHGLGMEILKLFNQMQQEGMLPDMVTFVSIFQACAEGRTLTEGEQMHARILDSLFESHVIIGNAIINMYGNCGRLQDARRMFDKLEERSISSWNTIIAMYSKYQQFEDALLFFKQMWLEGVMPDKVTFISILSACISQAGFFEGKNIHLRILYSGVELDILVATALVNMYGKCNSIEDASRLFDQVSELDLVLGSTMIAVFVQHGLGVKAVHLFDRMYQEGVIPGKVTFVSVLGACSSQAVEVKRFHTYIIEQGFESDIVVGGALISAYGKCGSPNHALDVFERMPRRDVVAWNAMITMYAQLGLGKKAFQLFHQMQQEKVTANKITFVSLLDACANQPMPVEGEQIHIHILNHRVETDVVVGNALVNMYGKCGSLGVARKLFDKMPERNLVSWNSIIAAYAQHGLVQESVNVFHQMMQEGILPDKVTFASVFSACTSEEILAEGKRMHGRMLGCGFQSDVVVGTTLVNMYGQCGCLGEALAVFYTMPGRNVAAWTSIIAAYAQSGMGKQAIQVFGQMQQEGLMPDKVTFISLLSLCATEAMLAVGKHIHVCVLNRGFDASLIVGTALITMYGKCGILDDARRMFDSISKCKVAAWNAMITVYAQHGLGSKAVQLFEHMHQEDIRPDNVTFLNILSACCHAGLVNEGLYCFVLMMAFHGMPLDLNHYVCMIDLLARSGQLDKAEYVMRRMPFKPTAESVLALLSVCRYEPNLERAEDFIKLAFQFNVNHVGLYILLANIYSVAGARSIDSKVNFNRTINMCELNCQWVHKHYF